jgi:hypothetical protein
MTASGRLLRRFAPRNDNQAICHYEPAKGGRGKLFLKAPKIYSKKLIIAMMRIFFNLLIGDEK